MLSTSNVSSTSTVNLLNTKIINLKSLIRQAVLFNTTKVFLQNWKQWWTKGLQNTTPNWKKLQKNYKHSRIVKKMTKKKRTDHSVFQTKTRSKSHITKQNSGGKWTKRWSLDGLLRPGWFYLPLTTFHKRKEFSRAWSFVYEQWKNADGTRQHNSWTACQTGYSFAYIDLQDRNKLELWTSFDGTNSRNYNSDDSLEEDVIFFFGMGNKVRVTVDWDLKLCRFKNQ